MDGCCVNIDNPCVSGSHLSTRFLYTGGNTVTQTNYYRLNCVEMWIVFEPRCNTCFGWDSAAGSAYYLNCSSSCQPSSTCATRPPFVPTRPPLIMPTLPPHRPTFHTFGPTSPSSPSHGSRLDNGYPLKLGYPVKYSNVLRIVKAIGFEISIPLNVQYVLRFNIRSTSEQNHFEVKVTNSTSYDQWIAFRRSDVYCLNDNCEWEFNDITDSVPGTLHRPVKLYLLLMSRFPIDVKVNMTVYRF